MRSMSLLLIAALGACATPPPRAPDMEAQARLQNLIEGKVAGEPVSCLRPYRGTSDMIVIDDNTIAFREGSRVYLNRPAGGCSRLGSGFYSLVTKTSGTGALCSGDIATVADLSTGMTVGTCVIGEFVPYNRQ